jgi:hypothetical protein
MKFAKYIFFITLLFSVFTGFSQRIVFKQTDTDTRYDIPKKGANRNYFTWVNLTMGSDLTFGVSDHKSGNHFGIGYNGKFKCNAMFSHGLGGGLHLQTGRLSKTGMNTVFRDDWNKGNLFFAGTNVNYFWRINFDPKRGNSIGTYLDVAICGQFNFYQQAKFFQGKLREKTGNANITERFTTGVEMRFGWNILSIYTRYNFFSSGSVSNEFVNLNLAKWSAGITFSIGN